MNSTVLSRSIFNKEGIAPVVYPTILASVNIGSYSPRIFVVSRYGRAVAMLVAFQGSAVPTGGKKTGVGLPIFALASISATPQENPFLLNKASHGSSEICGVRSEGSIIFRITTAASALVKLSFP